MNPLTEEHLQHLIARYERDPELRDELREKVANNLPRQVESMARSLVIPGNAELVAANGVVTVHGNLIAETIVHSVGRPVLTIRDNQVTSEFLAADSAVWTQRIESAKSVLDLVIPAVGRIEVANHPDLPWVGTGWLVADEIVVTNRHVAAELGRRSPSGFTFRTGADGNPMTSRIDFLEEFQRANSNEYALSSILWIAPSEGPDVAFLRVQRAQRDRPLPKFVALASSLEQDGFVATIGYPARDPRIPDQDLVRRIFGDVYDKKRLAPGQLQAVSEDEIEHDCSTLGGNSGSLLVSLRTGEALGLHFAGLYRQANFAVSAPKVSQLLQQVKSGVLPGVSVVRSDGPSAQAPDPQPLPTFIADSVQTFRLQIPVEITVKVGNAVTSTVTAIAVAGTGTDAGDGLERALQLAREALAAEPDVIDVRLGYRFKRGWITDERVVVVEVREKLDTSELLARGKAIIPSQFGGVGVDVRTAALPDQLEHIGLDISSLLEARPQPGMYREPADLPLTQVKAKMKATFHVSPDSGFPNLKIFLGRVKSHLSATMYEWDAPHVSDAIVAAMQPAGNTLRMVTQRQGTQASVDALRNAIGDKFHHVWASVGAGKIVPSAYHIKVASRDGEEFWLSSGNWKDSGQADIDPAGQHSSSMAALRQHNREWHVIIEHAPLATLFQKYIEFDFDEAMRIPMSEANEAPAIDLFVPEAAFLEALTQEAVAHYFNPLVIDRVLDVQPLLTPDHDKRGKRMYISRAIKMIHRATRTVYVENQSLNYLAENVDEFEGFFVALRDKQINGLDVRIIFRDIREFGAGNAGKQQRLLEKIKTFGLDTNFIRVQRGCHTKGIIIDSQEVLLGSHNLTNDGSVFNRDASLLVRDAEVAAYFEKVFLFDWENLSTQQINEMVGGVRVARVGEETPAGFRRVSLAESLGLS